MSYLIPKIKLYFGLNTVTCAPISGCLAMALLRKLKWLQIKMFSGYIYHWSQNNLNNPSISRSPLVVWTFVCLFIKQVDKFRKLRRLSTKFNFYHCMKHRNLSKYKVLDVWWPLWGPTSSWRPFGILRVIWPKCFGCWIFNGLISTELVCRPIDALQSIKYWKQKTGPLDLILRAHETHAEILLVRSCFLITLIKYLKSHRSLGLLFVCQK